MLSAEEIAKRCAAVDALGDDACFLASCKAGGLDVRKDLRYGNWTGIDFSHEELTDCDFTGADLTGCSFAGASITGKVRLRRSLSIPERATQHARFDQAILGRVLLNPERAPTLPAELTPVANLREALDWDIHCEEWRADPITYFWEAPLAEQVARSASTRWSLPYVVDAPLGSATNQRYMLLRNSLPKPQEWRAGGRWPLHRLRLPTATGPAATHLPIGAIFQDAPMAPEMVVVPPGTFSDDTPRFSPDAEPRMVDIGRLAVGRFPVTLDEWNFTPGTRKVTNPDFLSSPETGRHPIAYVSLLDITRRYLRSLNERLGLAGEGAYRLLTAAEWEYCCRGGATTTYCNGDAPDRLDDVAWHAANSGGKPHPVGLKQPNAFGLYDMHGNVAELTSERGGDDLIPLAIACGGSFASQPDQLKCTSGESMLEYGSRRRDIGFRVARNLAV